MYIFGRDVGGADNGGELRILHASDAQEGDAFGKSVAIDGDTIVVGFDNFKVSTSSP